MTEADTATGQHVPVSDDGPTQCVGCGAAMGRDDRFCRSCGASRPEGVTVVSHVSLQNAQAAQLISATEGEFEILERIGHGAMGAVYVAKDVALGRQVAIKVIAPHLLADPSMVSRFKLEAQTVASLRHPNIVNVHAVREADDLHYFVMEFIDGPTLRSLVKRHAPLDFEVVRSILYQVGSALNYAHQAGRGVIHRDIKPANIMLNGEGDSFLTDFGISKITEAKTGLTQTGATIGTPEYMGAEQCRGEWLTGASDQYALGIVAYERIFGATPFSGTQYSVMIAHAQEPPEPIRSSRPDCPPEIAEAVERMLKKTPGERWPDLDAAVDAMGGRPMGFRDPVRSAIVALVQLTEGTPDGEATAPASDAPTEVTGRPGAASVESAARTTVDSPGAAHPPSTAADPPPTADLPPAAPSPASVSSSTTPPHPGPSRQGVTTSSSSGTQGRSRKGLVGVLVLATVALAFFGGRALLGGAGAALGESEASGAALSQSEAANPDTTVVAASGEAEGADRGSDPVDPGDPATPASGGGEAGPTEPQPSAPSPGTRTADVLPQQRPAQDRPRQAEPPPAVPASITVRVPGGVLPVGERRSASATVRSSGGDALSSSSVLWSSRTPAAITIDGGGVLTGVSEGASWIVASVGGVTDSVQVTARAEVAEVRVEPGQITLDPGQTRRLVARAVAADGSELRRDISWITSDPAVVTVGPTGEVRAVGPGSAVVRAASDGVEGGATIRVEASAPTPPTQAELQAEAERYLELMVADRDAAMALWPEESGDEDLREDLEELLGRDDLTAVLQEPPSSRLADGGAVASFLAGVTHRGNFGRDRRGTVTFTMVLNPSSDGWRVVEVRAERLDGF